MKMRKQESKQAKNTAAEDKISKMLREARLNRHYSLNDLHRITKIKVRYLKDIDSGHFKDLPGGFYLRAFIKSYANTVGLNGSELLKRFNNDLPDLQDPRYMGKVSEDKLLIRAERQRVQNRHSTVRKYIPLIGLIIVIFFVLVGVWVVTSHYHNGLTTNYGSHSTSVSGESSISRPKHKKRSVHRVRNRRKVTIKRSSATGDRLVYRISTKVRPVNLKVISSQPAKVVVKGPKKASEPKALSSNQAKTIKLTDRDESVRLNVNNRPKVKIKVGHKVRTLRTKSLTQSIILEFSK